MRLDGSLGEKNVLLAAAHPDDEVIGAGAHLAGFRDLHIVHASDGAPRELSYARACGFARREEYACARRRELLEALALAGIAPGRASSAGFVDQELALHLAELARFLADALRGAGAGVVLTHPYEGGHPDHDATAFAVHAACALVDSGAPEIWEFSSYHNGNGAMEVFEFLGAPGLTVVLSPQQRELKRRMYGCFRSQREVLQYFPIGTERFRPAPRYEFSRPPHAGPLYYEHFDWGMTSERFCTLARTALAELGIGDCI